MSKNLTGIYKSYANKKSKYRNIIDISDLPSGRGLSKYTEKEMQKFIDEIDNRLAKINRGIKRKRTTNNKKQNNTSNGRMNKKELDEILKELNFKRNQMGSTRNVNSYLGSYDVGEYESLQELNFFLDEFKRIKGDITSKDITQMAKKLGYKTQKNLANIAKSKLAKFHLDSYKETLNYYGITNNEIEKLDKRFRKADFKAQDKFLKIIKQYAQGKHKYEAMEDETTDHIRAKDNFMEAFTSIVDLGGQ